MTLSGTPLLYEMVDSIARLTLNRPEKRNALDAGLLGSLTEALDAADAQDSVRVVTLTGAGPDFCAGADLARLRDLGDAPVLASLDDAEIFAHVLLQLRTLRKPVVALVRGRALAGGCGLATACDLVLAAESASFGYPEIRIGFVPAMVMALLRRNVPEKRAFEMIATGNAYSARESERLGLVNRVFPDGDFDTEADAFIGQLAQRSTSALRLAKRLLYHQEAMSFEAAVRAGVDGNVIARMTEDARAGVERFVEGRSSGE